MNTSQPPKITVYGIKTCSSVKKTLQWLKEHQQQAFFSDVTQHQLSSDTLHSWLSLTDWKLLLNKKSTTWRSLDEVEKSTPETAERTVALIMQHPKLLKRPVVHIVFPNESVSDRQSQGTIIVGHNPEALQRALGLN